MEDTPICASVERDLQLSLDELTSSAGAAPPPEDAGTSEGTPPNAGTEPA